MQRVVLTRKALYEMIWTKPMSHISKEYSISDYSLRKICKKSAIPLPKAGHWQKVRMGKQVVVPQLLSTHSGTEEVVLYDKAVENSSVKDTSPLFMLQQEIELELKILLTVPSKLINPDKLITAVKENVESNNKKYNYKDLVPSSLGFIDVHVSIGMLGRALRFMDTFIKCLKHRNHSVQVIDRYTYAVINGESIQISLREKLNRSIVKDKYWDSAAYSPSGILIFQVEKGYKAKEWKDGKRSLDDMISNILANLELKAKDIKERRIASKIAAKERRERQQIQYALKQRQEKELARFKKLLQDAKQWRESQMVRDYIMSVKDRAESTGTTTIELDQWLKWGLDKADWYDPTIKKKDELLDAVDKETLSLVKMSSFYY